MEGVLQMAMSNTAVALVFAVAALIAGCIGKRPQLTYLLWLLVLVKLLTPPMVSMPVIPLPETAEVAVNHEPVMNFDELSTVATHQQSVWTRIDRTSVLTWIWLLGSGGVLIGSLCKAYRFQKMLLEESDLASPEVSAISPEPITTVSRSIEAAYQYTPQ